MRFLISSLSRMSSSKACNSAVASASAHTVGTGGSVAARVFGNQLQQPTTDMPHTWIQAVGLKRTMYDVSTL